MHCLFSALILVTAVLSVYRARISDFFCEEASEISGEFTLISRIELLSGEINGDFPVILKKIVHFHVFWPVSRNFSVYLSAF